MRRAGVRAPPAGPWHTLRLSRARRTAPPLFVVPAGPVPANDAARRFWSERTWSEYAAIPAVSQVVLALVREGAPLDTLGVYTAIADDEVRHASLSKELADRLGGYVDEVPAGLDYAPRSLAAPSDVPVAVWGLANGCFSETVSLALIRARLKTVRHPVVRAVLAETLKDEALHVRVAWELAGELLPRLPSATRRELKGYAEELSQMLRRTFGTAGLEGAPRRRARALRDATAAAGLGALEASAADAVVDTALADIHARLARLR